MHDGPRKADDVLGDGEARDRSCLPIADPRKYHHEQFLLSLLLFQCRKIEIKVYHKCCQVKFY